MTSKSRQARQRKHNAVKRAVAEHSSKGYADAIRDRNSALLDILDNQIENHAQDFYITGMGRYGCLKTFWVFLGCPHCQDYDCNDCLWRIHTSRIVYRNKACPTNPCADIHFGNVSLNMVANLSVVVLYYTANSAYINVYKRGVTVAVWNRDFKRDCRKIRAFLKGHIEWSLKPYWGKKL